MPAESFFKPANIVSLLNFRMGVLPVKPASTETDSRPFTKSLLNPKKAFKKSSRQNLQQQQPSENTETSLVPVTDSNIASRHLSGFERPEPKQASLNNDKAWVLLEAQAKALQASAETARHLAQVCSTHTLCAQSLFGLLQKVKVSCTLEALTVVLGSLGCCSHARCIV